MGGELSNLNGVDFKSITFKNNHIMYNFIAL
jgi:hypothetical protein